MPDIIIIGSGPSAAGAALALAESPAHRITIIDLGTTLEAPTQEIVADLRSEDWVDWDKASVSRISVQPVSVGGRSLPEKRSFGSDFPFRNIGQLAGLDAGTGVNQAVVSSAYGGFSNVWGAQLMPFTDETLASWPIAVSTMQTHYRRVLEQIPFAADHDDLERHFPLVAKARSLPEMSDRSKLTLAAYDRHRHSLQEKGVTLGRARLAFNSTDCVRCGLCMTGCPYGLVYSASQTIDQLRSAGRVDYRGGLMALSVREDATTATVTARSLHDDQIHAFTADRVLVACGAVGSTRLVGGSLGLYGQTGTFAESVQFTLPFVSRRPTRDPRTISDFTLNQFNMLVKIGDEERDLSQLHFYSYNPSFSAALPAVLQGAAATRVAASVLKRLSVALGYLPSWASPSFSFRLSPGPSDGLPQMHLTQDRPGWRENRYLRRTLVAVTRAAPRLDLWPVLNRLVLSDAAKSYHWGASFPHAETRRDPFSSDVLGRVGPWRRIHLVDAAVFPNVPATTFTLTIMANAHRIATELLHLEDGR